MALGVQVRWLLLKLQSHHKPHTNNNLSLEYISALNDTACTKKSFSSFTA